MRKRLDIAVNRCKLVQKKELKEKEEMKVMKQMHIIDHAEKLLINAQQETQHRLCFASI